MCTCVRVCTCDSSAGRQTLLFRQEVVLVSYTASEHKHLTDALCDVVTPASKFCAARPDLHRSLTVC